MQKTELRKTLTARKELARKCAFKARKEKREAICIPQTHPLMLPIKPTTTEQKKKYAAEGGSGFLGYMVSSNPTHSVCALCKYKSS